MRSIFSFVLLLSAAFSQAQKTGLQVCSDKIFLKMDSVFAIGKDPFSVFYECALGQKLPGFAVKTIDGMVVDSNTIKGKILVLDFFMINCHPCIESMPGLNKLVAEYKDQGVLFLCLALDKKEFLDRDIFSKYKFDFPMAADAGKTIELFGGSGYPKVLIIDQLGTISQMWPGGPLDIVAKHDMYANAKPFIDKLLVSSNHKQ